MEKLWIAWHTVVLKRIRSPTKSIYHQWRTLITSLEKIWAIHFTIWLSRCHFGGETSLWHIRGWYHRCGGWFGRQEWQLCNPCDGYWIGTPDTNAWSNWQLCARNNWIYSLLNADCPNIWAPMWLWPSVTWILRNTARSHLELLYKITRRTILPIPMPTKLSIPFTYTLWATNRVGMTWRT